MKNKVQKIREEVERLRNLHQIKYQHLNTNNNLCHVECGKRNLCNDLLSFIDSLQEEPVSEGLEEAAFDYAESCKYEGGDKLLCVEHFKAGAKWQKEQFENDYTNLCNGIATVKGLAVAMTYNKGVADTKEQMMKNIWKDAQGDDLPEYEREVIVLCENGYAAFGHSPYVAFGHRPNPDGWDGRNIGTNEVTHYTPKLYDKGGWNQPNVKWWLDIEKLPNMEE